MGNVYIADTYNCVVRKVRAGTGVITTIAGTGVCGYSGDGGPATGAQLDKPDGIALDGLGNLYIADTSNQVILEVIAASGNIITAAGDHEPGFAGDGGPAIDASLSDPWGVAVDRMGNVLIGDTSNNRIREVTAIPNLNASAYSLDFPPQKVGTTSSPQPITLTGVGGVTISSITTTGHFGQTNNCPSSLTEGATCTVNVRFSPSAPGASAGTLVVATDSSFAPTITINLQEVSGLIYTPTLIYFGGEFVGTATIPQAVTIGNYTTAPVTFSSVATGSASFPIESNTCTGRIGKECAIGVAFQPTASGAAAATLVVKDSNRTSPQKTALHGAGTSSLTSINAYITGSSAGDFSFTMTYETTLAAGAAARIASRSSHQPMGRKRQRCASRTTKIRIRGTK